MKTIVVASRNPVKLRAIQSGFATMFPGESFTLLPVSVPSGVADQPRSDEETLAGALNRTSAAQQAHPKADYWAGVEGGVCEQWGDLWAFAWVVVRSCDPNMSTTGCRTGKARTGILALPPRVAELVRAGKELGEADDLVFGRENSKQSEGAVGLLTGGAVDRAAFYTGAVILALVPFKNERLYPRGLE